MEYSNPIINSRYNNNLPNNNKPFIIVIGLIILAAGVAGFLYLHEPQIREDFEMDLAEDVAFENGMEVAAVPGDLTIEKLNDLKEKLENEIAEQEEGTADFFYQRAVKKEKEKDYAGAVEDYTITINKAKKYSAEMWNSLNNRGVIKAKQLKNYRGAKKDFDKIISIETNRYNGEINEIRLEAGYTNRAYVRKMLGDKEGACDDLYEALSLGVESSVAFIEKKIDQNCM